MIEFDISIFIKIFSSWQVIFIAVLILVLFPVIFYIASFGKAPSNFKMKPVEKKIVIKREQKKEKAGEETTDNEEPVEQETGRKGRSGIANKSESELAEE